MPADHDHDHSELSDTQLRVRALETILTEKGYIDPAVLDGIIEHYETKTGSHIGARAIARAWVDPQFKAALLEDATKAIASLGVPVGDHLIAVENTPARHNMVVCTLCSCYPWDVLGYDEARVQALESAGIVTDKPVKARPVVEMPMDERVKLGRLSYWDKDYKQRLGIE